MGLSARTCFLLLVASALVAHCGRTPTAPDEGNSDGSPSSVLTLTSANFAAEVLQSSQPSLVEFYSTGCGACASMAPIMESLAIQYMGRAVVGNVNAQSEMSLSNDYRIEFIPTFLFFKNGVERARIVGVVSEAALADAIEQLLAEGS